MKLYPQLVKLNKFELKSVLLRNVNLSSQNDDKDNC